MLDVNIGDKINIYSLESSQEIQQQFYVSQVDQIIDDDHIRILAPIQKGVIVPLRLYQQYQFIFYANSSLIGCKGMVIKRSKKNNLHFMVMRLIKPFYKVQRRAFYRLECVLPFTYIWGSQQVSGIIKDISGGGIRFISDQKIDCGDQITCFITLPTDEIFVIKSKVLSKEKIDVNQFSYEYRVKFIDVDIKDQDKIIQYIFEEQRKRRSQEKGL
ncbi:MAG: hypothetical protein GX347_08200 [Epulopiscium sp.]|mgnify:CR=1 FL=1|nr:hypothetical protein [Candidatus Epulonipiscium sp.]